MKNEIGAFAPAACVLIETEFLRTLDAHNFFSGYAEMLKHGLISNTSHWAELLACDTEKMDYGYLKKLVGHSVEVKEDIVEQDPLEHGIRKALNLGHTVEKMRQTIQFIKENYGGFAFNCKQYDQLYELMKHDKKYTGGAINFTLLKEVGDICLNQTADKDTIYEMFDFYRE